MTPVTEIIGVKNWNDEKQCWIGVICQVMKDSAGKEIIVVMDIETAGTQVEIDDAIRRSLETRPWEKEGDGIARQVSERPGG